MVSIAAVLYKQQRRIPWLKTVTIHNYAELGLQDKVNAIKVLVVNRTLH